MRSVIQWPVPRPGRAGVRTDHLRDQAWIYTKAWAIPLTLTLLALLLRLYRLEELGTVPDTYERLFDARRIAHGEFPSSIIYPPGFSVVIALLFLIFPDSLSTMQVFIVASGVALVLVSYAWVFRLTGDRLAATLLAVVMAACPVFVFASRDAFFDVPNVLLIVCLLYFLPTLRNRGLLAFVLYGVLLAILVNFRVTSAALLPALLLLWLGVNQTELNLQSIRKTFVSARLLGMCATFAMLCAMSVLLGEWFGSAESVPITLKHFIENLGFYYWQIAYAPLGLIFVIPFAMVGLVRLWRINRIHCLAFCYLIVVWPAAHAPFDFANYRYMLPVLLVVFLLAAVGVSGLLKRTPNVRFSKWKPVLVSWSLAIIALHFAIGTGYVLADWPKRLPQTDEGLAQQFRPAVSEFEPGSLFVSAVARAFRDDTDSIDELDLIDHHLKWGTDESSLRRLTSAIADHLAAGGKVYYLYSHWEGGHDFLGRDGDQHYVRFFEEINREFQLTWLQRSTSERAGINPWILFEVSYR
jgi:hypothetical protein